MSPNQIVALDIATKLGIAILTLDNMTITVYTIEGSPIFQMIEIRKILDRDAQIIVEDFSYFSSRNPVTTASLNQRFGYLFYGLSETHSVIRYNVNSLRSYLGITGSRKKGEQKKALCSEIRMVCQLKLTTDETDAVALLLYHRQQLITNLHEYNFSKLKKIIDVQ